MLFAVPLAVAVFRLYRQEEVRVLQELAERTTVDVPANVHDTRDPMEVPRAEPGTRVAVYDDRAHLVTGSGPVRGDGPVRDALTGRTSSGELGDWLVTAVPVGAGERVRAVVRAGSPARGPLRRAALTWAGMAGLAAVAVGVGVALSVRSSRRLARPLEALAATARRLESGDLAARAAACGLPEADEVAAALNRAAERVERLLGRERAFSADASHQLRTALTRARLELESAPATGAPGPRDATRTALDSLAAMEATLGDLLSLARDVPERAPLHLNALLADAERRWHGELAAAGRPLRVVVEEGLPEAVGSPRAARQVLDVLLSNAAVHGRGVVTVRARDAAGVVAVDVEDEGPGLPDDEDVFARRRDDGGGHGIGLALARSLVEAEGGRLRVSRRSPHPCFTWLIAGGPEGPEP